MEDDKGGTGERHENARMREVDRDIWGNRLNFASLEESHKRR